VKLRTFVAFFTIEDRNRVGISQRTVAVKREVSVREKVFLRVKMSARLVNEATAQEAEELPEQSQTG
jgi:hypothetical protein